MTNSVEKAEVVLETKEINICCPENYLRLYGQDKYLLLRHDRSIESWWKNHKEEDNSKKK